MKYGLLTYKYPWRKGYRPLVANIGDYIQSIAARQFLPRVDVLVDRDAVASYSGDSIKVIMNGWWHICKGNEKTSEAITPLYVAYHIDNPKGLTQAALEHLKKHSPIGCRDLATMNCLQENGIEAYLSSCLTLTLGKTYHVPEKERTNTVYFVDCDLQPNWFKRCLTACCPNNEKLRRRALQLVEEHLRGAQVERRSHLYPLWIDQNRGFQIADQLLRDYSKAKLVITSRLHCALPVLSMGVPVFFAGKNLEDRRYAGTLDWISRIGFDRTHNLVELLACPSHIPGTQLPPPPVKDYADQLTRQCQQFV